MRAKAHAAGMSIEDFAAYNRRCPEAGHDRDCDQMIERFAEHDFVICEGRLPHFFMRNAFHVLLVCDLQVRVKRRKKQVGFEHLSDAEIMQAIIDRDRDDGARYRALYGNGCVWAPDMFGLVVDSTELSKEVTLARVVKGYEEWQQQPALV